MSFEGIDRFKRIVGTARKGKFDRIRKALKHERMSRLSMLEVERN